MAEHEHWCAAQPELPKLSQHQGRAAEFLQDGEIVTVDGHLGIVTVGPPEFELELS
jgi:hypothetical protein